MLVGWTAYAVILVVLVVGACSLAADTDNMTVPREPFRLAVRVEQKGEACPKRADAAATIAYHRTATASFRFEVDGKLSQPLLIQAHKVSAGRPGSPSYYLVEVVNTYHLDAGRHRFRIVMHDGRTSETVTAEIRCLPESVWPVWIGYVVAALVAGMAAWLAVAARPT